MESESVSESLSISKNETKNEQKKKKIIKLTRPNLKRLKSFTITATNPYLKTDEGKFNSNENLKQIIQSRNAQKKGTFCMSIFNYNKSANKMKNLKNLIQSNISPTLSTYENEKEISRNNNLKKYEEKTKNIHQKIYNMYNSYYKPYNFKVITKNNKTKEGATNLIHSPPTFKSTKKIMNKSLYSRSIETKSKTSKIKSPLKIKFNIPHTPNMSPKKRKQSILLMKTSPNKNLHEKISKLVEEIEHKNKKVYIPKTKSKEARQRLVMLLNRKKGIYDENLNNKTKKKMSKNEYPMLIKKPTNNIQMNNLIINSFSVGYNHIEFSKKLYDLNEVFFSLLENMKKKRAEIDIARFEKEKKKYSDNSSYKDYNKIYNFNELYYQRNNRDKWEKKFMLDQYEFKIPEKTFQKFKKYQKNQRKKDFIENSKKLSYLITKLDAEEYEIPDEFTLNYKSTRSYISTKNFKRISRLLKILKTNEDEEQTGNIILKADLLKKEQRNIENDLLNIIGKSEKTRIVKTTFKPKTIEKYKSISGNYFGLPV